jgi:EpsD family peptidyl-prolyl cis-trans isomerase
MKMLHCAELSTVHRRPGLRGRLRAFPAPFPAIAILLCVSACTAHEGTGQITQVVARVNGGEITVHQVNYLLENSPDLAAAQGPANPGKETQAALDQLIEQEILVQAAVAQKLDRNPEVLAAMESARRRVLAQAYIDQVRTATAKPTGTEIHAYFVDNPALFAQRRVYTLREFRVDADRGRETQLRSLWAHSRSWDALFAAARSAGPRSTTATKTLAAEQLPLDQVKDFQRLAVGAVRFSRQADTVLVQQVVKIVREPMSEADAGPMIEAYLLEQRRRQTAQDALARLKKVAQIEVIGNFGQSGEAPRQATADTRQ